LRNVIGFDLVSGQLLLHRQLISKW